MTQLTHKKRKDEVSNWLPQT